MSGVGLPCIEEEIELNPCANFTRRAESFEGPILDDNTMFFSDFDVKVMVVHSWYLALHCFLCMNKISATGVIVSQPESYEVSAK